MGGGDGGIGLIVILNSCPMQQNSPMHPTVQCKVYLNCLNLPNQDIEPHLGILKLLRHNINSYTKNVDERIIFTQLKLCFTLLFWQMCG